MGTTPTPQRMMKRSATLDGLTSFGPDELEVFAFRFGYEVSDPLSCLVGRPGLEPGTLGLKVPCSNPMS